MLGAFGAHALRSQLSPTSLSSWETAVAYQMYHALVLLVVGIWLNTDGPSTLKIAGALFAFGVVLFSGSIYALVLTSMSWLGPVTPLGGLLLMGGWATILYSVVSS